MKWIYVVSAPIQPPHLPSNHIPHELWNYWYFCTTGVPNHPAASTVLLCEVCKDHNVMDTLYLSLLAIHSGTGMNKGRKADKQKYLGTSIP